MRNGLYRVEFTAGQVGGGGGVVVLQDGKLLGGDSATSYVGTYSLEGNLFTATVQIINGVLPPNMTFIFGPNGGVLALSGTATDTTAKAVGVSPQLPAGITLNCQLQWVAE